MSSQRLSQAQPLSMDLPLLASPLCAILFMTFGRFRKIAAIALLAAFQMLYALGPRQIKVGAFNSYPLIFQDKDGTIKGLYVDLLRDVGQRENIQFTFVYGTWQEGLDRLKADELDLLTSVGYTEERSRYMNYCSQPILTVWGGLYTLQNSTINTISEIHGKKIGVLTGDIFAEHFAELTSKFEINCRFLYFGSYDDVLKAIKSKQVDAGIVDVTFGVAKQSEFGLRSTGVIFNPIDIYFTTSKNKNSDLGFILDNYLKSWKYQENSIFSSAKQKWLYGSVGAVSVVPRWLKTTLFIAGITTLVGMCFIILLKIQIKRAVRKIQQREEALRESESLYRSILEASPDAIIIADKTGRVLMVSPAARKLYGSQKDEDYLGRPIIDFIAAEDRSAAASNLRRRLQGLLSGTTEYRGHRLDGTSFDIEVNSAVIRDVEGRPMRIVFIVRDISERKRAEETIRKGFTALEQCPVSVVITDTQGSIEYVNPHFTEVTGYTLAEALGHNPRILKTGELAPEVYEELWKTILAGKVWRGEFHNRRKNGELFWEQASISPIRNAQGVVTSFVAVKEDITERKASEEEKSRLQAQLMQVQKMESLGSLAGGVAHDMNNVLGAILGLATVHIEAHPVGSPTYRAFDTITKAAIRGGKMVKSLLSFARQSPAEERELDINEVLREETQMLERTTLAKVRLEMDLASDLRPIRGDASALTHAFMNLCVNAVDAMPRNGVITLRTRNVDHDWVEVQVEDTGIGMTKEVLAKAMDPFFTTKEVGKGTGLGLSMVYRTVKAHQGHMEILSEPGQGTRVVMRFPVCEPAPQAPAISAEFQGEPSDWKLHVLAVDDEELIRCTMKALLEAMGHTVHLSSSGEEALALLEAGMKADVVILDINMPGLGGVGTLPRLRALDPELPILLSTGRVDQSALDLAGAYPRVQLLAKPFRLDELRHQLQVIGRT